LAVVTRVKVKIAMCNYFPKFLLKIQRLSARLYGGTIGWHRIKVKNKIIAFFPVLITEIILINIYVLKNQ